MPKTAQMQAQPGEAGAAEAEVQDFEVDDVPENKIEKITDSILR
jgi:hypothetical protein